MRPDQLRIVICLLSALAMVPSRADEPAQRQSENKPTADLLVTGMAEDLRLLRKTLVDREGDRVSSPEAFQAAARVFGRVDFVDMTRHDVLWMLGNPETLNDFGFKPKPGADASLIYRFDEGGRGRCYILEFKNDRVTRVRGNRKTPDEKAVDALVADWILAHNKGDAEAMSAFYVDDADFVGIDGQMIKGREAIRLMYAKVFEQLKGNRATISLTSRRIVSPETIIDDGTWKVIGTLPTGAPSQGRYTTVFSKRNGQWKILCARSMVPATQTAVKE